MKHRYIAMSAIGIVFCLGVTTATGCFTDDDTTEPELGQVEQEAGVAFNYYDRISMCFNPYRWMRLYWHVGGYCSILQPTPLCGMLYDQTCMIWNPRLRNVLQSVCWRRCWNVSYSAPDPAPPPSCTNPPCIVPYSLDGSDPGDGGGSGDGSGSNSGY